MHLLNHHLAGQFRAALISNVDRSDGICGVLGVLCTTLDGLDPAVIQRFVDADTLAWIWMQHAEQETSQGGVGKQRKCGTTLGNVVVGNLAVRVLLKELLPPRLKLGVVDVGVFCLRPWVSAVEKGKEHNRTGPDIQWARIVVT